MKIIELNTVEEAIKILKEDRETYQDFINQGYADNEEIKRGLLALDMAIEALEKRIPKKSCRRHIRRRRSLSYLPVWGGS